MSPNCHVDLDSLWMVHREDRRTVETGSHAGVSVWRRVLCGITRMSCLPEFPVNYGLKGWNDLRMNCVMDISACGTQSRRTLLLSALGALMGHCPHPIWPEYWFRPCLLGYRSQWVLLALWAWMGLSPANNVSGVLGGMLPSSDLR